MPTALMTGSFEWADPGRATVLRAVRGALPGWSAVAATEQRRPGRVRAALSGARTPLRFDATVITGGAFEPAGTPATPPPPGPFDSTAAMARLAARGPAALVGVSVPEIRGRVQRRLARAVARRSALLILRDTDSARALAQAGVPQPFRIGADPAWAAIGPPGGERADDRVVVVLCRAALGLGPQLAGALAPLARAGLSVDLLPWRPVASSRRRARLMEDLVTGIGSGCRVLAPPGDLVAARERLTGAALVVGFRHHALVAAAAAGVPFVAIGNEPGLSGLAGELAQEALPGAPPEAELSAAMRAALERAAPAPEAVNARIESAAEGLRLLRLVLSDGRDVDPREIEGLPLVPAPGR